MAGKAGVSHLPMVPGNGAIVSCCGLKIDRPFYEGGLRVASAPIEDSSIWVKRT